MSIPPASLTPNQNISSSAALSWDNHPLTKPLATVQTVAELLAQGDLDAFICDGATDLEEEEGSDSDPGGNSDDGILW